MISKEAFVDELSKIASLGHGARLAIGTGAGGLAGAGLGAYHSEPGERGEGAMLGGLLGAAGGGMAGSLSHSIPGIARGVRDVRGAAGSAKANRAAAGARFKQDFNDILEAMRRGRARAEAGRAARAAERAAGRASAARPSAAPAGTPQLEGAGVGDRVRSGLNDPLFNIQLSKLPPGDRQGAVGERIRDIMKSVRGEA